MSKERSDAEYIKELEKIAQAAIKRADEQTIKRKLNEINARLREKAEDQRS